MVEVSGARSRASSEEKRVLHRVQDESLASLPGPPPQETGVVAATGERSPVGGAPKENRGALSVQSSADPSCCKCFEVHKITCFRSSPPLSLSRSLLVFLPHHRPHSSSHSTYRQLSLHHDYLRQTLDNLLTAHTTHRVLLSSSQRSHHPQHTSTARCTVPSNLGSRCTRLSYQTRSCYSP